MKLKMFDSPTQVAWTLLLVHLSVAVLFGYQFWSFKRLAEVIREDKASQLKSWNSINKLSDATNCIAEIENIEERTEKWRKASSVLAHNWIHSEKAHHHLAGAYEIFAKTHKNSCLYGLAAILLSAAGPVWLLLHKSTNVGQSQ